MPITIRVEIDDTLTTRLEDIAAAAPENRRAATLDLTRSLLSATIEHNPVDTSRSRAAWVAALQQLGGSPPPGWEGPTPDAAAQAEGRAAGSATIVDNQQSTQITAANGVHYVPFLEYGTSRMAPFQMLRRALLRIRRQIPASFKLLH